MRLFDILGPVMVGPSSSHTAGAVRIGLTARKLLGDQPVHADISLHGSFALTGHGHGTDCALIAGLLGMQPDDLRIPGSFAIAAEQGLTFAFQNVQLRNAHPNTARLQLTDAKGRTLDIVAESVGGGAAFCAKGLDRRAKSRQCIVINRTNDPVSYTHLTLPTTPYV